MIEVFCESDDLVSADVLDYIAARLSPVAAIIERDEALAFGAIEVFLVTQDRIIELHETFFADPSPTDVITFPAASSADEGVSGEIAICVDVAREQAEEAEHAWTDEIVFLAVHGLLHLCGWDDRQPADRQRMLDRQEELIAAARQAQGSRS